MTRLPFFSLSTIVGLCILVLSISTIAAADEAIGVSLPLTGEGATFGVDLRNAIMFANEKLRGGKYKLVIENDLCAPPTGVTVAKKLIERDNVRAMIGFACSGAVLAVAPVLEKSHILGMVTGGSSAKISYSGTYIFRTHPNDAVAADVLALYIARQNVTNLGILSSETEYAQDMKNGFVSSYRGHGSTVIEDYPPNESDFRTSLSRLRSRGVDSIFLNVQFESSLGIMLRRLRDLRWHPRLFAAYYPSSLSLRREAGELLDGIEYVDIPGVRSILSPDGRLLYDEFIQKYGELRSYDALFVTGFEGFRALVTALESGGDHVPL